MSSSRKITSVKGMNDILPPHSAQWEWLESIVRCVMHRYAYRNLRTPIVEPTALFIRGLGQVTDIVEKEMYSFEDRLNGEQLTLRPEATAGVVRAAIEHSLLYDGGKRIYYMGPMFRHERPQRGRYRQFHQIGAEALGFSGPEIDAELILMANRLWQDLGLKNIQLEINSLGQPAERLEHRKHLIAYFEKNASSLDEDARRRLHTNPLRILDTKNPSMQELVSLAPRLSDFLGGESREHFEGLQAILLDNKIDYRINNRLVRGMDYYNLSVFEFTTDELGAQGTICGGGRYDYLFEQMGGKPTPAVGWAMGVERVLELLVKHAEVISAEFLPDAYAVIEQPSDLRYAISTIERLRGLGVSVQMQSTQMGCDLPSFKSQFKRADASGARFALIFGHDECSKNLITIKSLRDGLGQQITHSIDTLSQSVEMLKTHIKK